MNVKRVFCAVPLGATTSRASPGSSGETAMVHPSIEMNFLPANAPKGRDTMLAVSFVDSRSPCGAAEKPFVVRLARNATDNATLVPDDIAVRRGAPSNSSAIVHRPMILLHHRSLQE